MTDDERLMILMDVVAGTAAQLASRITLAMSVGGISPNRVVAWMEKFQPPPPLAALTAHTNALILEKCLAEITLFDKLKELDL